VVKPPRISEATVDVLTPGGGRGALALPDAAQSVVDGLVRPPDCGIMVGASENQ